MSEKIQVSSSFRGCGQREVELEIGKEYIIQPLNPRKKKNRDRSCVILDFVPVSEFHPNDLIAKVKYLDNNRVGRAELDDLVPASI